MTVFLSLEDALELISRQGVGPVRDLGLLDSALQRPASSLFGQDAYPRLAEKAAALIESIVRNHALFDGNKRFGWFAMAVFLDLNDVDFDVAEDDAYEFVLAVAAGKLSLEEITAQLERWIEPAAN